MNLAEIRQKYPQYNDIQDGELAAKLHQRFYPDLSFEDFSGRIGYTPAPAQPQQKPGVLDTLTQTSRMLLSAAGKFTAPPDVPPGLEPGLNFPTIQQAEVRPVTEWPQMTEGPPGPEIAAPLTAQASPAGQTATRPLQIPALAIPGEAELLLGQAIRSFAQPPPEQQLATSHVPSVPLAPSHAPTIQQPQVMVTPGGYGVYKGMPIGEPPITQEQAVGGVETLASLATAPVGLAAAGAAGLGAATAGQDLPNIAKAAQEAMSGLTYHPKTKSGEMQAGAAMAPFEELSRFDDKLARLIYEKTGSPFLGAMLGTAPELLIAATPFLGRFRRGPGKAIVPAEAEIGEGLSEGARLRKLAKEDPEAFRAAFEESLKKRMPPEAPGEAIPGKPPEGPPPVTPQAGGPTVEPPPPPEGAPLAVPIGEVKPAMKRGFKSIEGLTRRRDAWKERWLQENYGQPFKAKSTMGGDVTITYTRSAKHPGKWQLTWFNGPEDNPVPVSDTEYGSYEKGLLDYMNDIDYRTITPIGRADTRFPPAAIGGEDAGTLRKDEGPLSLGGRAFGGRGPGEGGENLQQYAETGRAAPLIEPPREEAGPAPREEVAAPSDPIRAAYEALKTERGHSNIEIADIRDLAGVSQAEIETFLKSNPDEVVLTDGDYSVADEHIRSGAVKVDWTNRPQLLAKFQKPDFPKQEKPAKPETPPAAEAKEVWQMTKAEYLKVADRSLPYQGKDDFHLGRHSAAVRMAYEKGLPVPAEVLAEYPSLQKAKSERIETAQEIIKTLIERKFKRIESYGVYSRQLLGRPELTKDEFYKIYDEYAAEFGGKERPTQPEPKQEAGPSAIEWHRQRQTHSGVWETVSKGERVDPETITSTFRTASVDGNYINGMVGNHIVASWKPPWGQRFSESWLRGGKRSNRNDLAALKTAIYDTMTWEEARALRGEKPTTQELPKEAPPAEEPKPFGGMAENAARKSAAHRLKDTAQRMREKAEEKLNAQRLENTPKRAREGEHQRNMARAEIAKAETMVRIADGILAGRLKHLQGVSAGTHVEALDSILRVADGNPSKAQMPTISVGEGVIDGLRKDIGEHRGGKALLQEMGMGRFFDLETAKKMMDFAKKNKITSVIWQIERGYEQNKRLRDMGITNADELRAALEEYAELKAPKQKEDPIKKMEAEVRFQKIPGFFPTPKPVINQMLEKAEIKPGMSVLEPSAGKGDIADAINDLGIDPDVVEINQQLSAILGHKGYVPIQRDFLEYAKETSKKYDRILMNPPFEGGQDAAHVMAAYDLLKPGGRLVAVMSPGAFFRSDKKATAFREWLDDKRREVNDLGQAFKGIEAFRETGVNSKLVTIYKDKEAEPKPAPKAAPEPQPQPEPKPQEAGQAGKLFEHWETPEGKIAAVDKGPFENWTFYLKPKGLGNKGTRIRGREKKLFFNTREGALIALQEYAAGRGWKPVGEGVAAKGTAEMGEAEPEKVVSEPTAGKLKPAEQKKWLVEEIETAIKEAPEEKGGWIVFKVPGDGEFSIPNDKGNLREFKKLTEKQWPTAPGPKPNPLSTPSTRPGKKRVRGFEGWYYNPFKPREAGLIEEPAYGGKAGRPKQHYNGGFFSDGAYVVAVSSKPKLKHPVTTATKIAKGDEATWQGPDLKEFMDERAADKGWKPAEIKAEFYQGHDFDPKHGDNVYAHVKTAEGDDIALNTDYVDSVLTLHPKAKPYAKGPQYGVLFKDGDKVVGLVMGLNLERSNFGEGITQHFKEKPTEEAEAADQAAKDVAEMIEKTKGEIEQAKWNLEKAEPLRGKTSAGDAIYHEQKRNLETLEARLRDFEKMQAENFAATGAPAGTASKGRYAVKPDLSAIEVSVRYQTPDGAEVFVRQTADEALKEISDQEKRMDALQKCLES